VSGRHPWSQIRDRLRDPESEDRIAQYRRAMEEITRLEQLREARGLTQADLAAALGVNQQTVSKREHSANPYLDSIREYVEGLGGELRLVAVFPDEAVEFTVPTR
jgi:transcriptional regulator with XRE-family HTH domain